jgi:small-conductance mechanosensitive channel
MTDPQYSPPPATPYEPTGGLQPTKSPILSILSLVGGIVGVLLSFFFGIGFIFSAAAVVLGFIGRSKEPAAKGMWLTGIILGFAGIAIALIIWIGLALLAAAVSTVGSNG